MSEYHVVQVKFKDESVLLATLKDMGLTPEVHEEAKHLHGYQGDKRSQKAHIIIPRKQVGSVSNDVGFERVEDGFVLHASAYDEAWRTGNKIKAITQGYAENKLKKTVSVMSHCSIFSREQKANGQVEIQLRIMD